MIGSHICDALLANGHRVVGLDNLSGGFEENVPAGVDRFYKDDIRDAGRVEAIFREEKPAYVIHAAAFAAEQLAPFIRRYTYDVNVLGSMSLINAAVRHECRGFVFLSSIAVYGHGVPPFNESTPLEPADPYGIAKLAVELDLKAAHAMFGLPFIIFRPFNVYGPRQNIGDAYRNVVGIFMNQCLQGKPLTIFGDGEQVRAFSHVSMVAPAIAGSIDRAECWGQTFNIGGAVPYTVNHLADVVAEIMESTPAKIYMPFRQEAVSAFCDQRKAAQFFGDAMKPVDLRAGLIDMAAWARKHGPRVPKKLADIEVAKNLPPSWAPE